MRRPTLAAATLVAVLALGACGGGGDPGPASGYVPPPPPPPPLAENDRLYYDTTGGIADSVRIVVRTRPEFEEIWGQATSRQASPPPPPELDFSRRMAVVVGAGRMTPEDQIRVDSVGIQRLPDPQGNPEEVLTVVVRTIRGCGRFALDAFPLEIVSVPRHEGEVRFVERSERDPNCGSAPPSAPRP